MKMKKAQKPREERKDEIFEALSNLGKAVGIYRIAKAIGMSRSRHLETIISEMVNAGELICQTVPYRGAVSYRRLFAIHPTFQD
jgi:hypothetical protein